MNGQSSYDIGEQLGRFAAFMFDGFRLSFQVFLRKGMGEARLHPLHALVVPLGIWLLVAYVALMHVAATAPFAIAARQAPSAGGFTMLMIWPLVAGPLICLHGWRHWKRALTEKFERRLDFYEGDPLLWPIVSKMIPKVRDLHVRIIVEPLLLIISGGLTCTADLMFGLWLIAGGASSFSYEIQSHFGWRARIRAYINQTIIAKGDANALRNNVFDPGGLPREVVHTVINAAFTESGNKDVSWSDLHSRLEPELQELMKKPSERAPEKHRESSGASGYRQTV